ncbi:hypothetical protein V3C99_010399 [Haemonchus contortus]
MSVVTCPATILFRGTSMVSPGLSVETNMIECLDDWTEALDDKLSCDVIYFDFAKAFDRVSHKKLIVKLKALKFHPIITTWISEYLSNRTFQVKIGQSFSEVRRVISGVPQGGVLSPVLFNVFTAELPDMLCEVGITPKVYADDIKIYKAISVEADSQELQRAIDLTVGWSKDWQLPIAPHKTVYMQLRSCTSPTRTYIVGGVPLSAVQSVRDLGFYYNDRLDFTEHIKTRIRLANLRTFQIFKGLSLANKGALLCAYKSYVRPLVESSTTVFNSKKRKHVYALEKVQNNFNRKLLIRLGGFLYSRIPKAAIRNQYLGLTSLETRRRVFDLCMVHRLVHDTCGHGSNVFKLTHSRTRGGCMKISLARPKTNLRASSFTFRAGSDYLRVVKNIPVSPSLAQFKRQVVKLLLKGTGPNVS